MKNNSTKLTKMIALQTTAFLEKLQSCIDKNELVKLTLTNKRDKETTLKKIIISPVVIKKGYRLCFVYRHNTQDITKNFEITESLKLIELALEVDFFNAEMFALAENLSHITLPNGKVQLRSAIASELTPPSLAHNRTKERLIATKNNIYLRELNITNANWEVRREMNDKYLQINKYIDLLAPDLAELKLPDNFHVVDMGSGKGYLTFALYDYLTNNLNLKTQMTGVEYREDLVSICNDIAIKAEFKELHFVQGTIEKTTLEQIDILIALHACDTATDDAIFRGIQSGAAMIVCAPCCHKQIRKAMNVSGALNEVMKFGILKERQAELLTDSLRALIMEAHGYKTKVFEFISSEHTPKNVMIVGRKLKTNKANTEKILKDIATIKAVFGIEKHYLETLLGM